MEILLLGIYSFFVWLIFIKLKWLPWNTARRSSVVIIPIVGLGATILLLNIFAPSSSDVRVFKYTVPIVSQVRGRVIEVPVEEGNRLVKKGDVLFRIDPTPYQLEVNALEAQLVNAQGSQRRSCRSRRKARGQDRRRAARSPQAREHARGKRELALARKRVEQYRELAKTGAGNRFDLERAETDLRGARGPARRARSAEAQARPGRPSRASGRSSRSSAPRSRASSRRSRRSARSSRTRNGSSSRPPRARRATATWSTCSCGRAASSPACRSNPVMTLVEADGQVVALYNQNELHQVAPGNEAEFALKTMPGRIIKGKVDSVIWAQGLARCLR